ncbi:MAG: SPASM domain-containing protein [Candidatus Hydrothermarchaeaceae archaeon]
MGNVREHGFDALWNSEIFRELRTPKLEGKCGVCKFGELCGGCRARAYALSGRYLATDPWCSYRPLAGEDRITLKTSSEDEMIWSDEARKRIEKVPLFVRKHVMREIERRAREEGYEEITVAFLDEVKPRGANKIKFTRPEMRG